MTIGNNEKKRHREEVFNSRARTAGPQFNSKLHETMNVKDNESDFFMTEVSEDFKNFAYKFGIPMQ